MEQKMKHCILVISLLAGVLTLCAASVKHCPKYCECNKSSKSMACDGRGGRLKWIPRPPDYVRTFHLTNADLGKLTSNHIQNLTFCNLTSFMFKGNSISAIQPNAFKSLEHLGVLRWQQKFLPLTDVGPALRELNSPITKLSLQASNVDSKKLLASYFQHLTELNTLSLNLNEITSFNTSGLQELRKLYRLNLNGNHLTTIVINHAWPSLRVLLLQSNSFVGMPNFCSGENSWIPRLQSLDVSDNAIRDVNISGLLCLNGLEKLVLSKNRIEHLKNNTFAALPTLMSLYLTSMSSLQSVEDLAFKSSSLQKILFAMNPAQGKGKSRPERWFIHTPFLKTLDMTNTKLKLSQERLVQLFLSLRNVEHLTLQHAGIKGLPVGVFSKLRKLNILTLSGNYLSGWDKDVFANVTSINTLNFDGCNIKIINEMSFPIELRLSVKKIDLANNPFTCTCEILWFRTWMKDVIANKSIEFIQYPHRYECRSPNTKHLRLADFNPTASSCAKLNVYTLVITVVLGVSITFIVAGLVIYRYRWYIFYWVSLIRRRRQHQDPERELKYDAFVSYSNPDADWMYEELLDYLEGEVGLILCEHSRDFVPGTYIVDNVFDAMDLSKKTILVISNEFMQSHWCNFELQMAFDGHLKQKIQIVVILKEHIQACHITSTLRTLLTSVVYIEWSEEPEARRLFRERIVGALQ